MQLDSFDRAILRLIQTDNRRPNREIAGEICLSETAVRRRLDRMRSEGVIAADVSLLERDAAGQTLIVAVTFGDDRPEVYERFKRRMIEDEQVSQVYSVAAPVDFIIHVHAATLAAYEAWAQDRLLCDPDIARFDTTVVFSTVKYSTALPVPDEN